MFIVNDIQIIGRVNCIDKMRNMRDKTHIMLYNCRIAFSSQNDMCVYSQKKEEMFAV